MGGKAGRTQPAAPYWSWSLPLYRASQQAHQGATYLQLPLHVSLHAYKRLAADTSDHGLDLVLAPQILDMAQLSMANRRLPDAEGGTDTLETARPGSPRGNLLRVARGGGDGYDSDASEEHFEFEPPQNVAARQQFFKTRREQAQQYAHNMSLVPQEKAASARPATSSETTRTGATA